VTVWKHNIHVQHTLSTCRETNSHKAAPRSAFESARNNRMALNYKISYGIKQMLLTAEAHHSHATRSHQI